MYVIFRKFKYNGFNSKTPLPEDEKVLVCFQSSKNVSDGVHQRIKEFIEPIQDEI